MIDDPELRLLFQEESEERLRSLEEGLRHILEDPMDMGPLENIFRDAHTIKGSARMLNISTIEQLAHCLEDGLDIARKARMALTPEAIKIIYEGIDLIRQCVEEEVSGTKAPMELQPALLTLGRLVAVIQKEIDKRGGEAFPPVSDAELSAAIDPLAGGPPAEVKLEVPKAEKGSDKRIAKGSKRLGVSTIRVDTQQINELMIQAAELSVAKNRIFGLLEEIDKMLEFWEEKRRSLNQVTGDWQASKQIGGVEKQPLKNLDLADMLRTIVDSLSKLRTNSYGDIHKLEVISSSFVDRIRSLTLVPLSKLFDLFPRMVQDLAHVCNKEIDLIIEGAEITVEKKIIEEMKDPLMHLLRNAISHGIESVEERVKVGKAKRGTIGLKASQRSNHLEIEVVDDGRGIDIEHVKAKALEKGLLDPSELQKMSDDEIRMVIFQSGFSTASEISSISGRGVGLDVVQNSIKKLSGELQLSSLPGKGCRFTVQLSIAVVNIHVMLFKLDKNIYAVPLELIEACRLISIDCLSTLEGHDIVLLDDQPITLLPIHQLLGLAAPTLAANGARGIDRFSCILFNSAGKRLAMIVDAIVDEQKVVVTPPGRLLQEIRWLIGETILKNGEVCMILNPFDLLQSGAFAPSLSSSTVHKKSDRSHRKMKILLVEDSYTIRLMLSRDLENEGFEVFQATNGVEGLDLLKKQRVDAVVTDVEMAEMDGLTMVSAIRLTEELHTLPIIIMSTKGSAEDRQKGLNMGANRYIAKAEYNSIELVNILKELLP
jgi:two-component system chemotaxis sensor kinase CheA